MADFPVPRESDEPVEHPAHHDRSPGPSDGLDPANKSLIDALRLSFRVLQIATVLLVIGYVVFASWQIVPEQYRGLRLVFGRVQNIQPLEPGGHPSWPYPIGEFILVRTAPATIALQDEFWLGLSAEERNRPFEQINRTVFQGLVPGEDGSVITADSNLAHARFQATYRVIDPRRFEENVGALDRESLIRNCVERGVVHAAAEMPLDDLLTAREALASRVKAKAQELLDAVDSGILIETVSAEEVRPPRAILEDFEAVNRASSEANRQLEQARDEATRTLNRVAGPAHVELLEAIERYEQLQARAADEPAAAEEAETVLARIDDLLTSDEVAGEVSEIINAARRQKNTIITEARNEAQEYANWIDQYRRSPDLTMRTLWSRTIVKVMARDFERFFLPPGSDTVDLWLNRNPVIGRLKQRARYEQELQNAPTSQ